MKNLTVYIGTIKKCLNLKAYTKDGDYTFISDGEMSTSSSKMVSGYNRPNTKIINDQAIIIENAYGHFYHYKPTNGFIDNLNIILDTKEGFIKSTPKKDDELFFDKDSLIPYYEEQPKKLSFRKLKNDLLLDSRIKTGIEH